MSCLITSGYSLSCRDYQGGVKNIYIGQYNGTAMTYTLGAGSSASLISAFGGTTVSFYKFEQPLETAKFDQAGQFSTENGTSFYEQTIELTLQGMSSDLNVTLNTLGRGAWRLIVEDMTGRYWLIGAKNAARVSASTPSVGKAMGDLYGTVLTFAAREAVPAYEVSSTAALSVMG